MKKGKNKRVVLAMSGGIDSSVAAALLKKENYDVIGVFMKLWKPLAHNNLNSKWNKCCSSERAKKVAKILNIPFFVFDFQKEFKKKVVDYFLDGYEKGLTPNPCVVCNKEIKFGLLLEKALKLDADYIATGHYARLSREFPNIKLLKAKDKNKDQSYFLWQLSQKQLRKVLFPLGSYTKTQVKELAKKFRLPVSRISESMEICFVKNKVNDFLVHYLKNESGSILTVKGEKIGQHQGLYSYTIGQRKGIKLPAGPYFVLTKDLKKNFLIVTKNEKDLFKKELTVKNLNWILGKKPVLPIKIKAKIRYRHKPATSIITKNLQSKTCNLKFIQPQRAITPGQSVVFYQGQEVLGGGIISK